MTKAVAVADAAGTALAIAADMMAGFEDMQGMGSENITQKDVAVPFIKCAQALSPEVNKRESAYIPGLEQGFFFNPTTGQFWDGEVGFEFVPVSYKCTYLEWVPRDSGGGLAGEHGPDILAECKSNGKGGMFLGNGNEVIETAVWYGYVLVDGYYEQAVISIAKTQFKKSKQLVAKLLNLRVPSSRNPANKFNPPFFYSIVRVKSVAESNDQGNWFGWSFALEGRTGELPYAADLIQDAVRMHKLINEGTLKADMSRAEEKRGEPEPEFSGTTIDGERGERGGDIPF